MFGLPAIFLSRTAIEVYAVIALGLFLLGMKHSYDERRRDEGRAEIQAKWDADKAARVKAYAAMTTQWVVASQTADKAIKERDDAREKRNDAAKQKAASLPDHIASMPVPFEPVVVLNDAIRESSTARPPSKPDSPAAGPPAGSNIGYVTQWGVECIAAYDEARQRVKDWQTFYKTLRDAQGKPEVSP